MELVKRYSKSPEAKKNLEEEYGAAYIEYFVNRFSTGHMEQIWERGLNKRRNHWGLEFGTLEGTGNIEQRLSATAFTTFLTTIRENKSGSGKSLIAGKNAMHWLEARHASGGVDLRPCPACFVPIEKDFGCDHMQCTQCWFHFCWKCLQGMLECSKTG